MSHFRGWIVFNACVIIINILLARFFTREFPIGLSLESEWEHVPVVTRIPLSILVDLNNAIVWMVSPWPLISKSSGTVLRATDSFTITRIFRFHCFLFFLVLCQGLSTYLFFRFLLFLIRISLAKSTIQKVLFFFVDYHYICFSDRD